MIAVVCDMYGMICSKLMTSVSMNIVKECSYCSHSKTNICATIDKYRLSYDVDKREVRKKWKWYVRLECRHRESWSVMLSDCRLPRANVRSPLLSVHGTGQASLNGRNLKN